ncbi:MAG: tRNA (adenosine(37)-N6)-dimethylallyltransferase MiaA [Ignavibacteria bacterium RIFOXYB2_FULL_35_12]|nr:MAG: tRNA (adenosine(37)-N6)-dimethylallyltransferase MiaA [Ignavibacteria bacterium GWA2_36_19]OGU57129.1 MAG: tRNA (adenosine(37)-N6)-dimethylallyltransferase MiaA [Ignavibacteria bacterium GWF2_35_20]OGU83442.1 MAG: tRNA (adenosine(37)-N6)-dimethylallyltransferase MiaA [Ignavibacteria bacterium RIFOXYA2_FULL_35_9]OGU88889.1 MAG: tRNA (adenosine(37)-N6)-dimethylallyltransferase MiaA [Ignavibacteria bacterium RIFOXYA12_FULL_35_25]OGU90613.1 MAG: tRNA (adenosine(37)-N6)-dimethylallyltransfer
MEAAVIVIVAPTCSGKTSLAIELALKLNTEIISADSRQVYKYLNIGTAKPTDDQRKLVKHYFVDTLYPDEKFNASTFSQEAAKVIDKLKQDGKIPIAVGGSGLYIKALIDGIIDEVETDEDHRNELYELRKKFGNEYLYDELKKVDPDSASKMLPQNWKRVVRALEVFHLTRKPIAYFHSVQEKRNKFIFKQYGLDWNRPELYKNIDLRVDDMISNGLVNEVKSILKMGYNKDINALNTVGYKEIISFLENKISLEKAVELIKRNTRHYAKRQLTWFRKDNRIKWFKVFSISQFDEISEEIIRDLSGELSKSGSSIH